MFRYSTVVEENIANDDDGNMQLFHFLGGNTKQSRPNHFLVRRSALSSGGNLVEGTAQK